MKSLLALRDRRHGFGSTRAAVLICLLAAPAPSIAQLPGDSITAVDGELIVECKLPGQMRKMGTSLMVPMPGKVEHLSKAVCEIRGGLYVMYDAADPAKAMKIWMDAANNGDANAQNRVGQIYELGVGTAPDFADAAKWYAKGAQNGSRAATVNLASLYDRGLGVPKDATMASSLFQKAQGSLGLAGEPAKKDPTKAPDKAQSNTDLAKAAAASLLDVGSSAGTKPTIILHDPKVVATRGDAVVRLRGEVKTKDIIGWVTAPAGLSSLKVNDRDVVADRFGYFSASVLVKPDGTKVDVVALDKTGARDELTFTLSPGATDETVMPPLLQLGSIRFGNFYALIIGNRHYKDKGWDELPNSESDARSVASVLERKYGFKKSTLLIDATHAQILRALNDYVKSLGPEDNLLIYYAGHGSFALGKRGYWIPVDARKDDDSLWIDNVRIGDYAQKMAAHKVIVVSDSCYSGAIPGAVPTLRADLSDDQFAAATGQLAAATSRTALGSGGLAPVLEGGAKDHSVFARAFLDALEANDAPLEGQRLYLAIRGPVLRYAQQMNFDQQPQYSAMSQAGHEGGDFIFVPKSAARAEISPSPQILALLLQSPFAGVRAIGR